MPFFCLTFVHQYLNSSFFFRYSPFFFFKNLLQSCYAFLEYGTISLCYRTLNCSNAIITIYNSLLLVYWVEEGHIDTYCLTNFF